ncbi:ATPase-AAA-core domain-containing protein [Mycena kentingensis (nom. inval.)]|nr:ATPase-AAA-core domain-containing protein [Mycena kentingensis (nom. inval.)]
MATPVNRDHPSTAAINRMHLAATVLDQACAVVGSSSLKAISVGMLPVLANVKNMKMHEVMFHVLSEIKNLALIVTMRGAERPAKIQWTRPFLPPLQPLPSEAALATVLARTDNYSSLAELNRILELTDNLPLALNLVANLVDTEGCAAVLTAWDAHTTSLISPRSDAQSSLAVSIELSLASPRMTPAANTLLSLLAIFPDGLPDTDLTHLLVDNVLSSKATLLRMSLAYIDTQTARIKLLMPIREYMQLAYPAGFTLLAPLQRKYREFVQFYHQQLGCPGWAQGSKFIGSNYGNLHSVSRLFLESAQPSAIQEAIYACIDLDLIICRMGYTSQEALMKTVGAILKSNPTLQDEHKLQVQFAHAVFVGSRYAQRLEVHGLAVSVLLEELENHLKYLNDPKAESELYVALAEYFCYKEQNPQKSKDYLLHAIECAKRAPDHLLHGVALRQLALRHFQEGDYCESHSIVLAAQREIRLATNVPNALYEEAGALRIEAAALALISKFTKAIQCCRRARALFELCGMGECERAGEISGIEAGILEFQTSYAAAETLHQQILKSPFRYDRAYAAVNIAGIVTETGRSEDEVQHYLGIARGIFEGSLHPKGLEWCSLTQATLDLRQGRREIAKVDLESCLKRNNGKDSEAVQLALKQLSDISLWDSDTDQPWVGRYAVVLLASGIQAQSTLQILLALCFLGKLSLENKEMDSAKSLFRVALDGFAELGVHRYQADSYKGLGDISWFAENEAEAVSFWLDAYPLYEHSLQATSMQHVKECLRKAGQESSEDVE